MKTKRFFVFGLPVVLLALGLVLAACPTGGEDSGDYVDTFVAVTNIDGLPTLTFVGNALSLSGTVVPANATNKTIVWSGTGVSNGVLTAASAGSPTLTATIANGSSRSSAYTKTFTVTALDAGTDNGTNTFTNTVWAVDSAGGVYVTFTATAWEAAGNGETVAEGTYSRVGGIGAELTITGGEGAGTTGLAYIGDDAKIHVANFGPMSGTLTKLNTALTLEGTWAGEDDDGNPVRLVAAAGGTWTQSMSFDGGSSWHDIAKGTYPTTTNTNPALVSFTQVNTGFLGGGADSWESWAALSEEIKGMLGGSEHATIIIYSDRCVGMDFTLNKQP
ncbi:MAG: hypothetical protein LBK62_10365 [Treponema sp.]|nr:hypothetical protein [Treponema sp.]